jgi:hypothetical protein
VGLGREVFGRALMDVVRCHADLSVFEERGGGSGSNSGGGGGGEAAEEEDEDEVVEPLGGDD